MILHGEEACKAVEYKEQIFLTPEERRVVMVEGYSTTVYLDTKGIETSGVGQTGKWLDKPFRESFDYHVERVCKRLPSYPSYPEYLRCELIASEYRGDLGLSPKAVGFLRDGRWKTAAEEFLNNAEYKNPATPSGIKRRMEALHYALMLKASQ